MTRLTQAPVHPHGRGDNLISSFYPTVRIGSPPRAWGQCCGGDDAARLRGSPPRAWGQCCRTTGLRRAAGSPPRAWGQFAVENDQQPLRRFTPTGVGTMTHFLAAFTRIAVHPHGRGDNTIPPRETLSLSGSPPRAWGQSRRSAAARRRRRFTPTGVGTIWYAAKSIVSRAVHPHGRGDNDRSWCDQRAKRGSPPRAWGQ